MSMREEIPIDFYIFDQVLNAFYHVYEKSDWKISVLPYQQLQEQVNATVFTCNAVIANSSQRPTDQQIKAMTDVLQWGREKANKEIYQLELYFDPKYCNSTFINCFDNKINSWIDDYDKSLQREAFVDIIGFFIFIGAVALIGGAGFFVYQKWKDSASNKAWGAALFTEHHRKDEDTALIDMSHVHQYGTNQMNMGQVFSL